MPLWLSPWWWKVLALVLLGSKFWVANFGSSCSQTWKWHPGSSISSKPDWHQSWMASWSYLETSSGSPEEQVTTSDWLWEQFPFTRWSVEMCHLSKSFWGDAMVPADYTTMTMCICVKVTDCRAQQSATADGHCYYSQIHQYSSFAWFIIIIVPAMKVSWVLALHLGNLCNQLCTHQYNITTIMPRRTKQILCHFLQKTTTVHRRLCSRHPL